MALNNLEIAVIKKFFESEQMESDSELLAIQVIDRDFTPVGFFTTLEPSKVLISNFSKNFTGGRVGAIINNRIDVGFVMYIEGGCLDTIEGHIFGDELWPEKIDSFEIYLINYQKLGPVAD